MTTASCARTLALYLPQFHPVPENDAWHGPGFTEWTNVARARPLFRGHDQPNVPSELGFYDLRLPEAREAQAALAASHGIEGFVYWHYWFGRGRRMLERPFSDVLSSGRPNFPFCLAWANSSWSGVWYGEPDRTLVKQTYPGAADHARHFMEILPALRDERYVRVDDRPLFVVFAPSELPDANGFAGLWRGLAEEHGLPGLHLVGFDHQEGWRADAHGFDGVVLSRLDEMFRLRPIGTARRLRRWASHRPRLRALALRGRRPVHVYRFADLAPRLVPGAAPLEESYPCVIPNWDNTPRAGARGSVGYGSTPDLFVHQLRHAIDFVSPLPADHRLLFVKSWNEWAEGNYLEPDLRWGRAYLEALASAVG